MVQLSWPETALFLVLLGASAAGFWIRFGKVWHIVLRSKKDPEFSIQPVGRRVRDFVWEVMLQGKVIRERPLPGLAHAFVFWGFCAFAVVTINHFGQGVRLHLLSRDGIFGMFYFAVAAIFGVLVAVSISSLAFRRFVIRPKWLGPLSYESGFIALLIFLLMVTYLGTFPAGRRRKSLAVVGPHTGFVDLHAADPAHQTFASGAEPGDRLLEARQVQQDTAAGRR